MPHQHQHQHRPLILASGSPRRAELLHQIGLAFEVQVADIDETPLSNEIPTAYVQRLASGKAAQVMSQNKVKNSLVLAADTTVVVDGTIFGKPESHAQGLAMLARLSNRAHSVYTGIAVTDGDRLVVQAVATEVTFRTISASQAERYWRTREPLGKAGGYAIQGIGAVFIEAIVGSYSNVVGLPLAETEQLLNDFGLDTWSVRSDIPSDMAGEALTKN